MLPLLDHHSLTVQAIQRCKEMEKTVHNLEWSKLKTEHNLHQTPSEIRIFSFSKRTKK